MLTIGIFRILLVAFLFTGIQTRTKDLFETILEANEAKSEATFSSGGESNPELVEGDIVLTDDVEAEMNNKTGGDAVFDARIGRKWRRATVPYTYINKGAARYLGPAVRGAIKEFACNTCINWKYITRAEARRTKNYVEFYIGRGCFSWIGIQRGPKQQISLGRGGCAIKGIAMHEMMHALGFWHEQSRLDRDKYIIINWRNIKKGAASNFKKYKKGQASMLGERYDKQSVMHYGNYAFSKNRQKTIVSKSNRNEKFGQRRALSRIDIAQLNKYYGCAVKRRCNKGGKGRPKKKSKKRGGGRGGGRGGARGCKNGNQYCGAWKKQGYCTNFKGNTYYRYMKKKCRPACGFC